MAKLTVGDKLPDFTFQTVDEKDLKISEAVKAAGKTALVFLRYYGCPFCQLDMHDYAENFDEITANGGRFYVVLQSDPEKLSAALSGKSLPYPVICDPGQELYRLLDISAAASMENMMGPKAPAKIERVKAGGYQHGDYEGEELQLPATFVVDPDLNVLYAHYAAEAADSATADELIRILK
ncbi:MAG: AhpC/TSA family protein [Lachnospiraceae bacterium]|nr:AhpC/TSA family protein [Lachnospiraceae bacterium]